MTKTKQGSKPQNSKSINGNKAYNILFCAAEVFPFAKVGGLADVAGALPHALALLGHNIYVVMPFYKKAEEVCAKQNIKLHYAGKCKIPMNGHEEEARIFTAPWHSYTMVFISHPGYFSRDDVYGFHDDLYRFIFFCRAALEAAKVADFKPDLVHAHDWHAALLPVFLKTLYKYDSFFSLTASMFTIHNLAYQGVFDVSALKIMGLGWEEFTMDKLEFYGRVNMLKGGIVYGGAVSTVSEKYMEEIQTTEYGEKLDGLLYLLKHKLHGITNGIDRDVWDAAKDKLIAKTFTEKTLAGKKICKAALQKECGFPQTKAPLFSMVTRLADQKGLDILAPIMEDFLKNDVQFVVLGTGGKNYEELFQKLSEKYPSKVKSFLKFDDALSHRIYAGSDFFAMPSRFEPCGLGQLIAMRYGTIPVVRKTGGLSDTVHDFSENKKTGNGVVFETYAKGALLDTLLRSISLYKDEISFKELVLNALRTDSSWENSARKYLQIYETITEEKRTEDIA